MKTAERTNNLAPVQKAELPPVPDTEVDGPSLVNGNFSIVAGVKVAVEAIAGRAELSIGDLFALKEGSVIKLDQAKDAAIEIQLNGQLVASGHLVVVGEQFGVCISEILPVASSLRQT